MSQHIFYKTISKPCNVEIPKIKWSRFIGHLVPVKSKIEAKEQLALLQKFHHNATHNCYAYHTGIHFHKDLFGTPLIDPKTLRASDDGEPSGTAAHPMKNILKWAELHNVLLVVTRYYGGTLLGVGGLIQAYWGATKSVISVADIIHVSINDTMKISFKYDDTSWVMRAIEKNNITIVEQHYWDMSEFLLEVNIWIYEEIKEEFKRILVV